MVLLYNVYLINSSANPHINLQRGFLKYFDKVDVAKYSLSSLSYAYNWKRAIINVEFSKEYEHRKEEFESYVRQLFKDTDLVFSFKRNICQEDWIETYNEINDEVILYLGNHDHIFIDSSTEHLNELVEHFKKNIEKNPSIIVSHWLENIRLCKSGYIELNEYSPRKLNNNYEINKDYASYNSSCIDSLLIINKNLYKAWFLEDQWNKDMLVPRTDGIGRHSILTIKNYFGKSLPIQFMICPMKELFRHFDGYMHQNITNNICPSLIIPDGFFENDIKVRYGYDDRKYGWININPKIENYYAYDNIGTDDKITLEDIPLFWKNKISEIDICPNIDEEELIRYRLQSILKMVYFDERYNPYIDQEVENFILNKYLENYKQYSLY